MKKSGKPVTGFLAITPAAFTVEQNARYQQKAQFKRYQMQKTAS